MSVLVAVLAGAVVLVVGAASAERPTVQDLGVIPHGPVVLLERGQQACQTPVGLAEDVQRVGVLLGPFSAPRGPVTYTLRRGSPDGPVLADARLAAGPLPSFAPEVPLSRTVQRGQDVALCVRNDGAEPLELIGDEDTGAARPRFADRTLANPTRSTDDLTHEGRPLGGVDLTAYFPDTEPRSLLERIPATFRHAAAFKMAGVGAWTYWLLLAVLLLAGPWLLVRALSGTLRDDEADQPEPETTRSSSAA